MLLFTVVTSLAEHMSNKIVLQSNGQQTTSVYLVTLVSLYDFNFDLDILKIRATMKLWPSYSLVFES